MTTIKPTAWAVYGRKTGSLRDIVGDDETARDLAEYYDVVPLYPAATPPADDVRATSALETLSTYEDYKDLPIGSVVADISGYWRNIARHHVKTSGSTWAVFFHFPTQSEIDEAVSDRRNNVSPAPLGAPSRLVDVRAAEARVTPPADDVREALAEVLYKADIDNSPESQLPESWEETCAEESGWAEGFRHAADRVRLAFEVRPYGTVTDAEVKSARNALRDKGYVIPMYLVRAALEAAWGVRPRGTVTDAAWAVGAPDATNNVGDWCREHDGIYCCTRQPGHEGPHASGDGEVIAHAWGHGTVTDAEERDPVMEHVMTGVREAAIYDAHARRMVTPPADDVREALLAVRDEIVRNGGKADAACLATLEIIAARAEVRPRGTVTDTERAAINGALSTGLLLWITAAEEVHARNALLDSIVTALEAAREVRS